MKKTLVLLAALFLAAPMIAQEDTMPTEGGNATAYMDEGFTWAKFEIVCAKLGVEPTTQLYNLILCEMPDQCISTPDEDKELDRIMEAAQK